MNLQQLSYFLAAVEHGSFSAAADSLHLAQPSVSEQVRRLEDELGVALFQRVGRGLVLTEAGRALRPHAESVLDGVQVARESVLAVRELRGGTASFGTFATAGQYLGADLVARFRRRHPAVRVRMLSLNSAEAADDVREARLEWALVALPVDDEGLEVRPVTEDELLFTSVEAGLLGQAMTIERLAGCDLILSEASYGVEDPTRRRLNEVAQRAGVSISAVVELDSTVTALELAAAGVGGFVGWRGSLLARGRRLPAKLGYVPFEPRITMTLAFVFRRGAPLSPAAKEMVAMFEERLRTNADYIARTPTSRPPSQERGAAAGRRRTDRASAA
ncbi:MAG: LysR family transcriptional regulator [Solirubrobacteraceae bacterium]|nr:LysR family transcriptional regulator [Solirubrobacteraceae bacterium]